MPTEPPFTAFERLWLTEAVRLAERHQGPHEDAEANRVARAAGGSAAQRIERRALWLAARDGLDQALRHARQGLRLATLLLALLALFAGSGLAIGALGDGRQPVNLFWALGGLLGLHVLSLAGWALGLLLPWRHDALLGRLWRWLATRLARDAGAARLGPALDALLRPGRLGRWALGLAIHGWWALALGSALFTLLVLLTLRRYGFVWESTLLEASAVVPLTQAIGALPAQLGFALPSAEQVLASGLPGEAGDGARQAWASWLTGALLVYGLVPRLLLAALCAALWRRGRGRLALDLDDPDYRLLLARLQPASERLGVSDPAPPALPRQAPAAARGDGQGTALLAIELDDRRAWPPPLPDGAFDAGVLDDRQQRRAALERFARQPPTRLLVACDPLRSPDRGTLALIAELARCAARTRVWLLPAPAGEALDPARLRDWRDALAALDLDGLDETDTTWLASP